MGQKDNRLLVYDIKMVDPTTSFILTRSNKAIVLTQNSLPRSTKELLD